MEAIRKQDPTFTNFVPKTAAEAVDRYVRCRKNGLKAMLIPECLIACAVGLTGAELDQFEDWIINPNADLSKIELVPENTIRLYNNKVYEENVKRHERGGELRSNPLVADGWDRALPPVPRAPDVDDEKMPVSIAALQEAVQEKLCLSPSAPQSMLLE